MSRKRPTVADLRAMKGKRQLTMLRVLTLDERYEMQQLLATRGFDIGNPDGRFGPRTRIAIRNYQASVGLVPDGFASSSVLDRLRQP